LWLFFDKKYMNLITKNIGVTEAEKYLGGLCEKSFLSLWSYPGLFKKAQKELCDLLVVFGNDIIIFSDKDCSFDVGKDLKIAWDRWYKRAVIESANQAWGAENWIKQYPKEVYLDSACQNPYPFELPDVKSAKFHLVIVAHQISDACKAYYGSGSGSLMVSNDEVFASGSGMPFVIGDLDKSKTFVHFFDDTTLDIVMKNIDTITDFVSYLNKKEKFMRSGIGVMSAGEEELLAYYLKNMNKNGEHDFVLPKEGINMISLDESFWESFKKNPQRLAQKEEDKVSYFWDHLIEMFAKHAQQGTEYFKQKNNLTTTEKILRFLAKESRFNRRILSKAFLEIAEKTPKDQRMLRCLPPHKKGDPYYVFLIFPWKQDETELINREVRVGFLEASMRVFKLKNPEALDIIGIATESGRFHAEGGSEDVAYLDTRVWTKENEKEARSLQDDLGILVKPILQNYHEKEYPEIKNEDIPKNPRNKPCYCGSGVKYKKCHGK
jgi:hypothetical protein